MPSSRRGDPHVDEHAAVVCRAHGGSRRCHPGVLPDTCRGGVSTGRRAGGQLPDRYCQQLLQLRPAQPIHSRQDGPRFQRPGLLGGVRNEPRHNSSVHPESVGNAERTKPRLARRRHGRLDLDRDDHPAFHGRRQQARTHRFAVRLHGDGRRLVSRPRHRTVLGALDDDAAGHRQQEPDRGKRQFQRSRLREARGAAGQQRHGQRRGRDAQLGHRKLPGACRVRGCQNLCPPRRRHRGHHQRGQRRLHHGRVLRAQQLQRLVGSVLQPKQRPVPQQQRALWPRLRLLMQHSRL